MPTRIDPQPSTALPQRPIPLPSNDVTLNGTAVNNDASGVPSVPKGNSKRKAETSSLTTTTQDGSDPSFHGYVLATARLSDTNSTKSLAIAYYRNLGPILEAKGDASATEPNATVTYDRAATKSDTNNGDDSWVGYVEAGTEVHLDRDGHGKLNLAFCIESSSPTHREPFTRCGIGADDLRAYYVSKGDGRKVFSIKKEDTEVLVDYEMSYYLVDQTKQPFGYEDTPTHLLVHAKTEVGYRYAVAFFDSGKALDDDEPPKPDMAFFGEQDTDFTPATYWDGKLSAAAIFKSNNTTFECCLAHDASQLAHKVEAGTAKRGTAGWLVRRDHATRPVFSQGELKYEVDYYCYQYDGHISSTAGSG